MRLKLLLLSIASALLLSAAWPPWGFSPLVFIAFLPLLLVQHIVSGDNRLRAKHLFVYAYITFLIWNVAATWWVWNSSAGGALLAFLANSLLMALVFMVFHKVKRNLPERLGNFVFIPVWISFEYLHLDWDLSWPWLTLGNVFAGDFKWIQWYEYTGVFGGSLWVLLVNVLLFELYVHRNTLLRPVKKKIIHATAVTLLIVVPIVVSYLLFNVSSITMQPKGIDVVVVQPNVDPYKKFNGNYQEDLNNMLALAASKADTNTRFIVFPETAIAENLWENEIDNTWSVNRVREFAKAYPRTTIVFGASTSYLFGPDEKPSVVAKKFKHDNIWYEDYNTALQFVNGQALTKYHKSKLVPGVEQMPYPAVFGILGELAINMGGTTGTLAKQKQRTVFESANGKVAPVICYESIYGNYVAEYVRNGAEYIFIITNDGWWGNTPGYKQHLLYGRLRAIETRKAIARSANTGISCFIDPYGNIEQPQPWWTARAIKQRIASQPGQTFYVRFGDYIAVLLLFVAAIATGWAAVRWYLRRKRRNIAVQ
ncbi:MAG: apolipoprotein N-acyltransferase [Bacteroidetes bacterium]|nr:apolipoprotein N-acyltransferase [Bacteroidota bacterium]